MVRIKNSKETDYADFTAAQNTAPSGQAMVRFIGTWSGMMECVMEHGASDVTEAAAFTVQAAADAAPRSVSSELHGAIPKLADAYPCILETAPDLLEVQQMITQAQPEAAAPAMSM